MRCRQRGEVNLGSACVQAASSLSSPCSLGSLGADRAGLLCFVKQIFRKSSSNSFGSQHERSSDFTKGCGTYLIIC